MSLIPVCFQTKKKFKCYTKRAEFPKDVPDRIQSTFVNLGE